MAGPIISSFNAGEWASALFGRIDLQKYYSACEILENMVCKPHGPAVKRPGTYFVQESMGRDEITNGTFGDSDGWTLGTGFTIAAGTLQATAGTASTAYRDISLARTGTREYEICYELSDMAGGEIRGGLLGTPNVYGAYHDADGTYREKISCEADLVTQVCFYKTDAFVGKVDNVTVREINPITRLLTFNFSTQQNYALALTEKNMRFFKNEGIILDANDKPVEIETPFLQEDLFDLDFTQSADTFYIAHASYKPHKLERFSHTDWSLSEITFQCWPGKDIVGARKIGTGGDTVIEVDVPGHGYIPGDDIIIWDISTGMTQINGIHSVYDTKNDTFRLRNICGNGYTDYTQGGLTIRIAKVTGATQANPVVVTAPHHRFSNEDRIYFSGIEGMTELNLNDYTIINKTSDTFELKGIDGTGYGAFSGTEGRVNLQGEDFSLADHHPSCVEFFEERLFWANTNNKPQTLWGSAVGDYQNNRLGAEDDDAIEYTIAAKGVNPILWLAPQDQLLMGTVGAEWKIGATSDEEPITMYNVQARRQSTWGSKKIPALLVNDVILFVQRGGTKVRELTYSLEKDGFVAPDLTMLAEHIFTSKIMDMAYQQEPTNMLWCVCGNGTLACMVYERNQDVVGWSRILTKGTFKSVAVIPTPAGEDCVWVAVNRKVQDIECCYIEYLKPWEWENAEKCFFVDSGISYDGGARKDIGGAVQANPVNLTIEEHGFSEDEKIKIEDVEGTTELNGNVYIVKVQSASSIDLHDLADNPLNGIGFREYVGGGTAKRVISSISSGLEHLCDETCAILADSCVKESQVINSNGGCEVGIYANQIHIGLAYTAKLKPLNLEAGQQEGTAQGKIKRIHALKVRFQDTMACQAGTCEEDLEEILFRSDSDPSDIAILPFTGDKELSVFPGSYESNGNILLVNECPLPITVTALMPRLRTYSGNR
jgi:hypothetical protein